jgi:undecaprenyl-diphosphatase
LFELPHVREGMRAGELSGEALALGLLAAGLSGLGAIAFLLRYLRRHTTAVFILYRLALAVLVLSLAWQGRIR